MPPIHVKKVFLFVGSSMQKIWFFGFLGLLVLVQFAQPKTMGYCFFSRHIIIIQYIQRYTVINQDQEMCLEDSSFLAFLIKRTKQILESPKRRRPIRPGACGQGRNGRRRDDALSIGICTILERRQRGSSSETGRLSTGSWVV